MPEYRIEYKKIEHTEIQMLNDGASGEQEL